MLTFNAGLEYMQLSFGNMTMELNIFNITKQPHSADDGIVDVDLIETIVDNTFLQSLVMILYKHV